MFDQMKVRELRTLISNYRQYHTIKGYSKMKKAELVAELSRRFTVHNGQLFMKQSTASSAAKKRINPAFVGQLPTHSTQAFGSTAHSKATQRALEKADELEKYYSGYDVDEYPRYGF
jgi:hypothetical protein